VSASVPSTLNEFEFGALKRRGGAVKTIAPGIGGKVPWLTSY